jgi:hypothetical protein
MFEVHIAILGQFFFCLLFAVGALVVYRNSNSGYGIAAYCLFAGAIGAIIFTTEIRLIFMLISAIGVGVIIYKGVIERRIS